MPLPSTESNIKHELDSDGFSKFGFVIYRTTYTPESDVLWTRFQNILQERARLLITDSDTPELLSYLDYRFVENRAQLDGANVTTLRTIFDSWRRSPEAQAEQPNARSPVRPSYTPRYKYFVRADAEVLDSVASNAPRPPELDISGEGFVDFVDADWRSERDREAPKSTNYGPIEGCEEYDVGWMRMASWMLATDAYDTFSADDIWHYFYQRPPHVFNH